MRRYEVLYIGDLCIVIVVFCCASVWGTVYGGLCILIVVCC